MNEIFALHIEGNLLTARSREELWKQYSNRYGSNDLYGWKVPKPLYTRRSDAQRAIKHLPKDVQSLVEIVRYVPEEL